MRKRNERYQAIQEVKTRVAYEEWLKESIDELIQNPQTGDLVIFGRKEFGGFIEDQRNFIRIGGKVTDREKKQIRTVEEFRERVEKFRHRILAVVLASRA